MNYSAALVIGLALGWIGTAATPGLAEGTPATELGGASSPESLEDFRQELLGLAYQVASAIPLQPHIKDRSRAQEEAVLAALELEQPALAISYLDGIANWRRGLCAAEIARYFASRGDAQRAMEFAGHAEAFLSETKSWRHQRLRARIAVVHALLGDEAAVKEYTADLPDAERGKVQQAEATDQSTEPEELQEQLDELMSTGVYDAQRNALDAYLKLYRNHYNDESFRAAAEDRILGAMEPFPIIVRLEFLEALARIAAEHGDQEKALGFVAEAQDYVETLNWLPEDRIGLAGKVIELRAAAGDVDSAKALAAETLELYETEFREKTQNFLRGKALRPIAEAYAAMGEQGAALAVYRKAVEEGAINPNTRPRAEDLAATARSMALHGVKPDEELWNRMRGILAELRPAQ